jgi:hypothetical protein
MHDLAITDQGAFRNHVRLLSESCGERHVVALPKMGADGPMIPAVVRFEFVSVQRLWGCRYLL